MVERGRPTGPPLANHDRAMGAMAIRAAAAALFGVCRGVHVTLWALWLCRTAGLDAVLLEEGVVVEGHHGAEHAAQQHHVAATASTGRSGEQSAASHH